MDLAARKAVLALEGDGNVALDEYGDPDSGHHARMIDTICEHLGLTTLQYQRLDDMVAAIGLPPNHLCTYCWNQAES
jgi:amidophosphoribosyltransferase